jgi:hypothetical protein
MAFGIPSEDFHGGFGLPHDEFVEAYQNYMNEYKADDDLTDEECDELTQESYDNMVRALVEAGGEIREAKELLARALEMLYLLGYDSSFTNSSIDTLTSDIKKFLEGIE